MNQAEGTSQLVPRLFQTLNGRTDITGELVKGTKYTKQKRVSVIKRHGCQDKKNNDQRRRLTKAGIQWQEPGEHVRDDKTRLQTPALEAALTFNIAPHELR